MALGTLLIWFIAMVVFSVVGLVWMFLSKKPAVKTVLVCVMGVWGLYIGFQGATAQPDNFIMQQVVCWIIGALGVIAIPVKLLGKSAKTDMAAYLLTTISVAVGTWMLYFF